MRIEYSNMPKGASKLNFIFRFYYNRLRTWFYFNIKYPWIDYQGFVRILKGTVFAKNMKVSIGHNVQFGIYNYISTNVQFFNNILMGNHVCFIGRHDHAFSNIGETIWQGERNINERIIVNDDVWIGANSTILSDVTIGRGSIIAAGTVVTKSIPPYSIVAGVPGKILKYRFTINEIIEHEKLLYSLEQRFSKEYLNKIRENV